MRKLKRVVIKEELVDLTGSIDAAIVINQMIYWSERVKDFDKFIEEENSRAEKEGIEQTEYQNGWIYKSADQLETELLRFKSTKTIARILDNLTQKGWLSRRRNPKYKWDKTYQYRVNYRAIQHDLVRIGYTLEGYESLNVAFLKMRDREDDLGNGEDKVRDRSIDFGVAIPKTTTEITTEITTTDVVGIFRKNGIEDIETGIKRNPELLPLLLSLSGKELTKIAKTLQEKKNAGIIRKPVGLLLKSPESVIQQILSDSFYPIVQKKKQYGGEEYEIFLL